MNVETVTVTSSPGLSNFKLLANWWQIPGKVLVQLYPPASLANPMPASPNSSPQVCPFLLQVIIYCLMGSFQPFFQETSVLASSHRVYRYPKKYTYIQYIYKYIYTDLYMYMLIYVSIYIHTHVHMLLIYIFSISPPHYSCHVYFHASVLTHSSVCDLKECQ